MGDCAVELALDVGAEHAEGPVWDAATARLWWVDIIGEQVHRFDPATGADTSWRTDGQPGGVLIDTDGVPVVGMPDGLAVLEHGTVRTVVPVEADRPENRINDMKADSTGRIWAGSMAYERLPGNGALHRIEAGEVTTAVDALTISNGPAIDEAAGLLYLADTAAMVVDVFDFDVGSGVLRDRRRFLDFGAEQIWPDGMTVDNEGFLWIALGRASAVRRFAPDGSLVGVVELPVTNPTSIAFGGEAGDTLFITTSRFDVPEAQRGSQPLAGAIFRCSPGVSGAASARVWPVG